MARTRPSPGNPNKSCTWNTVISRMGRGLCVGCGKLPFDPTIPGLGECAACYQARTGEKPPSARLTE